MEFIETRNNPSLVADYDNLALDFVELVNKDNQLFLGDSITAEVVREEALLLTAFYLF